MCARSMAKSTPLLPLRSKSHGVNDLFSNFKINRRGSDVHPRSFFRPSTKKIEHDRTVLADHDATSDWIVCNSIESHSGALDHAITTLRLEPVLQVAGCERHRVGHFVALAQAHEYCNARIRVIKRVQKRPLD